MFHETLQVKKKNNNNNNNNNNKSVHIFSGFCFCFFWIRKSYLISILIYLLTAIGLTPGGSSTVHIYTQIIHRTTQSTQTVHRTTQST